RQAPPPTCALGLCESRHPPRPCRATASEAAPQYPPLPRRRGYETVIAALVRLTLSGSDSLLPFLVLHHAKQRPGRVRYNLRGVAEELVSHCFLNGTVPLFRSSEPVVSQNVSSLRGG